MKIEIIDADEHNAAILERFINAHSDYAAVCTVGTRPTAAAPEDGVYRLLICHKGEAAPDGQQAELLEKPIRAGRVLDKIAAIIRRTEKKDAHTYVFSGWALNSVRSSLKDVQSSDDEGTVRLTDKERDMLLLLLQDTDRSVSKEVLLEKVWGYADSVETHTLETHIYRLRQKIEKDPSAPVILITTEEGYKLVV